jgi:hypothetical protein
MEIVSRVNIEGGFGSLFQPDTLLPDQYLATFRRKYRLDPERRLMLAVLENAIDCFQKNLGLSTRRGAKDFP